MKTILVPTDFSDHASNALDYAIQLAIKSGANLVLMNVYHLPLPAGELPLALVSPQEIVSHSNARITELENSVRKTSAGKFHVKSIVKQGFAAEEIVSAASGINADVIVMGIKGSTSALSVAMGSITTDVIRRSHTPVLSVPASAAYSPVKNLAFAFDYSNEPDERVSEQLKAFAKFFDAQIQVVNIIGPEEIPGMQSAIAGVRMEEKLESAKHKLYFPVGTDVIHELDKFIRAHHSDLLVMVPHEYNFLSGLFHTSTTKQAAFRINTPLLTIHE